MRRMLQECAVLLGLLICAHDVSAQTVQQSSTVTPGHGVRWVANGVVGDAGTASTPNGLTSIGTVGSGPTICAHSATSGAKNRICLSATATSGGITMDNIGGGTGGFTFTLNGVVQGTATVTLPVTTNDAVCFADTSGTLKDCGGPPLITTLAHTHIFVGNSSNVATDYGTLATFSDNGTLTITPTASTNTAGLAVVQSGPSSGTPTGPINLNSISITSYGGGAAAGSQFGDFGLWTSTISAFRVNFTLGGNNLTAEPYVGITGHLRVTTATTSNADFAAAGGLTYVNVAAPNLFAYGTNGAVVIDGASTTTGYIAAMRAETDIINGATVAKRNGVSVANQGTATATGDDAAFAVSSSSTSGSFKSLMSIDVAAGATNPFQTTGSLFSATGAFTVANIFNLSGATVTGNILNFANATLSGAGTSTWPIVAGGSAASSSLTLESTTGAGTTDSIVFKTASQTQRGAINTSGQWTIGPNQTPVSGMKLTINANTAAPNASGITGSYIPILHLVGADNIINGAIIDNFTGFGAPNIEAFLVMRSARGTGASPTAVQSGDFLGFFGTSGANGSGTYAVANTAGTFFGAAATQNWTTSNNGTDFRVYTTPNNTNAAALVLLVGQSGGMSIGSSTDPGAGIINTLTGYRINNAAVSGNFLRGNGTNFVSATISASDLPAPYGATSYTSNGVLYGNGASNIQVTAQGGANTVLTANAGAPSFSAAPVIGTSVTTPIIYGGSAASSTLSLESTSGAGTTDSIGFYTASQTFRGGINTSGQWSIGPNVTPSTSTLLTVNRNSAAPTGTTTNNIVLQAVGVDSAENALIMDTFSTANHSSFWTIRRGRGTAASFSAVQSGDNLGFFGMVGANGTNTFPANAEVGAGGGIFFGGVATETWSSTTNLGAKLSIYTTPTGTGSVAVALTVQASGGVSIGTTTDPGAGGLQLNTKIFAPNLATTTAALGAALCWTTTTGEFQRDTNAGGCLVSSGRYKHDIRSLEDSLSAVLSARPVSFVYNDNVGIGGEQVGFIAEELEIVDMRLVGHDASGRPNSVRYMQYTAVLTRAVQQLKADNDNLRAEVFELKRRVK